jgi:hypothetical protein
MTKKIFLVVALIAIAFATTVTDTHLITFKNAECEAKVEGLSGTLFGNAPIKFMKSIGVMSINMNVYQVMKTLFANSTEAVAFKDCINSMEQDQIVEINDPQSEMKLDATDYFQWQLKRISIRKLPLAGIKKFEKNLRSHVYVIDSGIDGVHPDLK